MDTSINHGGKVGNIIASIFFLAYFPRGHSSLFEALSLLYSTTRHCRARIFPVIYVPSVCAQARFQTATRRKYVSLCSVLGVPV